MMTPALNNDLSSTPATYAPSQVSFVPDMKLADIEREVILETLKRQNFNRTRAARVLGIGIRTLQRKLKQYGPASVGLRAIADA